MGSFPLLLSFLLSFPSKAGCGKSADNGDFCESRSRPALRLGGVRFLCIKEFKNTKWDSCPFPLNFEDISNFSPLPTPLLELRNAVEKLPGLCLLRPRLGRGDGDC